MEGEASILYKNIEMMKDDLQIDPAYYNSKIKEYNSLAKKVNDAIDALRSIITDYNAEVREYNLCISL